MEIIQLFLTKMMSLNVTSAEGLFILNAVRLFPFISCPLPFNVKLLSIKIPSLPMCESLVSLYEKSFANDNESVA